MPQLFEGDKMGTVFIIIGILIILSTFLDWRFMR